MSTQDENTSNRLDQDVYGRNLPDLSSIQPRNAQNAVGEIFATRCRQIGERIVQRADQERETNINNFDSGSGLEDIIREELANLCPRRYTVTAGTVDDRNGHTAGDFEIVIADDLWTPILKAGATASSRRVHIPVEALYGVIEVKQSMDLNILDTAMKKIVMCHRLYRPPLLASQFLENQNVEFLIDTGKEEYHMKMMGEHPNPLFSAILAVNLKPDTSFDDLTCRFALLNKQLRRQEIVQALCVLREGCATWVYFDEDGVKASIFRGEELEKNLYLIRTEISDGYHPFYNFTVQLLRSLFLTRVVVNDLPHAYGPSEQTGSFIVNHTTDMAHPPDSQNPNRSSTEIQMLRILSSQNKTNK